MKKRMWCLRGQKDRITIVDKNNHTRTQYKKGAHYIDCTILSCERHALGRGGSDCYDPERYWCIPNDAPIYEVKRLWWRDNQSKIEKSIRMVQQDKLWLENFIKENFGVEISAIHQLSLKEANDLFKELKRKFQWKDYRDDIEIDCFFDSVGE